MNFRNVVGKFNELFCSPRKTRGRSELSQEELAEYYDTGCGEGYSWWLRHQGLPDSADTVKDYYRYVREYHKWMGK